MKKVVSIQPAPAPHWVGDGFPVRTIFSFHSLGYRISPFLLLDYQTILDRQIPVVKLSEGAGTARVIAGDLDEFKGPARNDATVLLLNGAPIDEPVAAQGPFVMNSQNEIRQAIEDYHQGRLGRLAG